MSYIVLDFETYYDKEYSLKKMTPVEYLLSHRFELHGCAIVEGDEGEPYWLDGDPLLQFMIALRRRQKAGEKLTIISHNMLFDGCLLAWRIGLVPDLYIDTLAMSRALLFAFTGGVSLERVALYLGLPPKGNAIKHATGLNAAMLKANGQWNDYVEYAKHDAWLCREIYKRLRGGFPPDEVEIADMVMRCAIIPRFKLDSDLLAAHRAQIVNHKETLLARIGLTDKVSLMSNEKFAAALLAVGIDPPLKTSPLTGRSTYAFAKSDPAMVELAEHPNIDVQALIAARVGVKSTLEETRTEKLLTISMIDWPHGMGRGWAPIPLRYSGAHTHRLSGDWKLNAQNWPKYSFNPDGTKEIGKIRRAHIAPPGFRVVKADASQIEARLTAWLCHQDDLVEAFRAGRDIYSEFAGENIYQRPITKADVDERFVGKNAILGLGFNMGPPKFKSDTAAKSYVTLGRSIILPIDEAARVVYAYRGRFHYIAQTWVALNGCIQDLAQKDSGIAFGPVVFQHQKILLPNGLYLYYRDLHWRPGESIGGGEWWCLYGKMPKKIFGGKVLENVVQALARIITMQTALRMKKLWRFPLAHQIHDDLVYVVREDAVAEFKASLEEQMTIGPGWAAGLPLAAEAAEGPSYGECK